MVAPLTIYAVNNHDCVLFDDSLTKLMETADLLELEIKDSFITFDAAFDSEDNKAMIRYHTLKPIIYPNRRNTQDPKKLRAMFEEIDFNEEIYKERYRIERCFAWEDTYRKLVIRYEKLQCTHLGFKYLAFSMINFRHFFGKNHLYSL